jgi:hypothetical protein
MTRANGAPEFLRRNAATDLGKPDYAVDLDEPRIEPQLGPDDFGGRRNARQRSADAVNLCSLQEAIGNVAASNVRAAKTWEDKVPLDDIAERMSRLTYGELVEFAEGLVKVQDYKATDDPSLLASFLWKWCVNIQQEVKK